MNKIIRMLFPIRNIKELIKRLFTFKTMKTAGKVLVIATVFIVTITVLYKVGKSIEKGLNGISHAFTDGGVLRSYSYWEDPLLEDRLILSTSGINESVSERIVSQLFLLEKKAPGKEINLVLRTDGGSRGDWIAIVEAMHMISSSVNVTALGNCTSAGAYILVSATGKRSCLKTAMIGIHMNFPKDKKGKQFNRSNQDRKRLLAIWKKKANLPSKFFPKKKSRKFDELFYLTAEEALKYGVVDEVFELEEGNSLNPILALKTKNTNVVLQK